MIRPVIVGAGEIRDRPDDPCLGLDPLDLMAQAARRAEADAGLPLLNHVDAVEVIHQITWRYEGTADRLCERMNLEPARAHYHPGGGESPLRVLHDAVLRIASGESEISLICGAEARNSLLKARRAERDLPWPPRAKAMEHPWATETKLSPLAFAHGVAQPTYIYPFYENGCTYAWGQSPGEAMAESAELWARYARVAADNPYAWIGRAVAAEEIATVSAANPLIAYPYTRLMVANPTVNLGAALIVMSDRRAAELGIAPEKMIHLAGGAASSEPADYLARDNYWRSPSQDVVIEECANIAGGAAMFDAVELYSCFPCVPKMALRTCDWNPQVEPTVTGGLTFFGGPFNNYMLHATCAMTHRLRASRGTGLLYGQGDFVTKHHGLVVSTDPPSTLLTQDYRIDDKADARRGMVPPIVETATGTGIIETFTVIFDRAGSVDKGVVVLRTEEGSRTLARVPRTDTATIDRLIDQERSPIGTTGRIVKSDDGLLEWSMAL